MPLPLRPALARLRPAGLAVSGTLALLAACATGSTVLVGPSRPAIAPDQVQVYLHPPAAKYLEIANISASSRGSLALGSGAKIDKVVERLKVQAAKVGANGVLLHGVGGEASTAVGGGLSTDNGRSPYVDVGGSLFLRAEVGDGVAIYVAPE
ncbi:MAG TPA: hypothetical protein VHV81_09130 [Steroidobacteraceae bacterium]|nr:hypothetical protein [Steroidobacteraceae bacterium]